ncbi:hypothetical protein [Amycolatopsis sp. DG1A-15b]|uniref:hypothetical protein n=1 Tax=Amycolatopsis sp. DG1A-15b TaxID=3052846 RepID=UPI00255B9B06|nr:hypothetical protein [Amycolatopsis sp. DG1A-15b]WIX85722.1 hypothetical protein QRY02_31520 [Amycolatopsis sp. DG1A-15b]
MAALTATYVEPYLKVDDGVREKLALTALAAIGLTLLRVVWTTCSPYVKAAVRRWLGVEGQDNDDPPPSQPTSS